MKSTHLPYSGELSRKALHLLTLAIPGGLLLLGKATALPIVAVLTLIAVSLDILRSRYAGLNRFIIRWLGFMMRPTEQDPGHESVMLNGATWVLLGATLCMILYPERIAAAALCMFLVGDAAAALVGRRWGKHSLPGSAKTIEGSFAFLLVAVGFGLWLPGPAWAIGLVGAVTAAVTEALPMRLNDNLTVPTLAGLAMLLIAA